MREHCLCCDVYCALSIKAQDSGFITQEDLNLFEASEDADEEFYAGGGQYRRHGLEHFPQLWCQNGSYSVYGQVRQMHWRKFAVT